MPRSLHGGRHELGQNFLVHAPTIRRVVGLVARTRGDILELGAGDGALTRHLATLNRPLTALELDEHRAARLARRLAGVDVVCGDALQHPLTAPVVVGNVPFHITTPVLRRLLRAGTWQAAVLITQWEVARKRAGIGGGTMMTAQSAPWFVFELHGRVPAHGFAPRPSVDGGILTIERRATPLVPPAERRGYEGFVHAVFSGRGGALDRILARACGRRLEPVRRALAETAVARGSLARDVKGEQWAALWRALAS